MKTSLKILFLSVAIVCYQQTSACSIFTSSQNGQVLVGANEDGSTSFHHMWFVPATEGKYGAVFFGQHNMQTQAGMNEHGLFFDFAAIPRINSAKREINFITIAEILSRCKTVDEALVLYQTYTFSSYGSQMLLADATGKSALINADTIVHKAGNYQITTNFNICELAGKSYDCLRYDKIDKALSTANEISVSLFQDILEDVHQEGKVSTQYSNIYDLKNGKVYVNWFHNYHETIIIDLTEELNKGFRIESLGDQFQQKSFAAIHFQQSEEGYFYNTLLQEFEQHGLEAGLSFFERYTANNPDKSKLAQENLNWIPYGLIAKARTKHDNLSFDFYYISFLQTYKPIWQSNNKLLHQSLAILDYLQENQFIHGDFYFHETHGYIHMVLGNKTYAMESYEKAIAVSEKESRERTRATRMLEIIKKEEFPQAVEGN